MRCKCAPEFRESDSAARRFDLSQGPWCLPFRRYRHPRLQYCCRVGLESGGCHYHIIQWCVGPAFAAGYLWYFPRRRKRRCWRRTGDGRTLADLLSFGRATRTSLGTGCFSVTFPSLWHTWRRISINGMGYPVWFGIGGCCLFSGFFFHLFFFCHQCNRPLYGNWWWNWDLMSLSTPLEKRCPYQNLCYSVNCSITSDTVLWLWLVLRCCSLQYCANTLWKVGCLVQWITGVLFCVLCAEQRWFICTQLLFWCSADVRTKFEPLMKWFWMKYLHKTLFIVYVFLLCS